MTRRRAPLRAQLPGSLSGGLVTWVVEPRHEGGRADDAILTVSAPGGKVLGTMTVGWLREHTDLRQWEEADNLVHARPDDTF